MTKFLTVLAVDTIEAKRTPAQIPNKSVAAVGLTVFTHPSVVTGVRAAGPWMTETHSIWNLQGSFEVLLKILLEL